MYDTIYVVLSHKGHGDSTHIELATTDDDKAYELGQELALYSGLFVEITMWERNKLKMTTRFAPPDSE